MRRASSPRFLGGAALLALAAFGAAYGIGWATAPTTIERPAQPAPISPRARAVPVRALKPVGSLPPLRRPAPRPVPVATPAPQPAPAPPAAPAPQPPPVTGGGSG